MRVLPVTVAVALITGAPVVPARADTGSAGPVTVTVSDAAWTSYGCMQWPASVTVTEPTLPWAIALTAAPTGQQRLDGDILTGAGPADRQAEFLLCPADSDGPWTVTVNALVGLDTWKFQVGFHVRKLATTMGVVSARKKRSVAVVKGTVGAESGVGPRADIEVLVWWDGQWKRVGYTAPRANGKYRLASAKKKVKPGSRILVRY